MAAVFTCELCSSECKTEGGLKRHKGSSKRRTLQAKKSSQPAAVGDQNQLSPVDRLRHSFQSTRTLRRITRGARPAAAVALFNVVKDCTRKNDTETWCKLLGFASVALKQSDKSSKGKENLISLVKDNILRPATAQSPTINKGKPSKPADEDAALRKRVEGKVNEGNIGGAVRTLVSEDSIAPRTAEVLEAPRLKHPPEQDVTSFSPEPESDVAVPPVLPHEISQAIISFPNGSGGGPDGLRPPHLKDLTNGLTDVASNELTEALAGLMTIMLSGKVPADICPFLYGASLTALKKKDGGIRPIAVGSTLRRIAGKIVSKRVMLSMGELLRPEQVGYGTRGGAEAAVHAARLFVSSNTNDCQVLLKLDFKNAFNTVYRERLLSEVRETLPDYYASAHQLYRHPSNLFFGEKLLSSARCVQQGDPLGPLFFCHVTRKLSKSLVSPFNCWYLDDATIGGDTASVLEDFETVKDQCASLGLELNLSKCECFVFGGVKRYQLKTKICVRSICPEMVFLTDASLTLLGAPVLPPAITPVLEEKTGHARLMTSRLTKLAAHQALFPKLLYVRLNSCLNSCMF
ncbi:hypothetical protein RvY_12257 [Ramazzottius varieornatus]|uniref:Reverse transcriptase domain-containing protein n=1 Tax=Ramazzottius varieornatus TaxID=947166 RepID=A0A1D1VL73_RAMVA|nr:hypothetical protein RvY_12257 [Ramazzottius varieornatus]